MYPKTKIKAISNQKSNVFHIIHPFQNTTVATTFATPDIKNSRSHPMCDLLLLYLLLQGIKFRRGEEFAEGDFQTVANHFDGRQFGVLTFTVQDILDAGGRQRRKGCQPVDADISLPAQAENTIAYCFYQFHVSPSHLYTHRIAKWNGLFRLHMLLLGYA